eukprot:scaffold70768_cov38-Prasinocladus_malaysianus.AAC.2
MSADCFRCAACHRPPVLVAAASTRTCAAASRTRRARLVLSASTGHIARTNSLCKRSAGSTATTSNPWKVTIIDIMREMTVYIHTVYIRLFHSLS